MKRTLWFCLFALLAIIGYDVWTLIVNGYETTISATTAHFCAGYPIIPWALGVGTGVVAGHCLWLNQAAAREWCKKRGWTPPEKEIDA